MGQGKMIHEGKNIKSIKSRDTVPLMFWLFIILYGTGRRNIWRVVLTSNLLNGHWEMVSTHGSLADI